MMSEQDCSECGKAVENRDAWILYQSPDPHDTRRTVVHGKCLPETAQRVSDFAWRVVEPAAPSDRQEPATGQEGAS